MTKIDAALDACSEWFNYEGVDMVIPSVVPGQNKFVIVVVTTVDPEQVKQHIPSQFLGFQIDFQQINPILLEQAS